MLECCGFRCPEVRTRSRSSCSLVMSSAIHHPLPIIKLTCFDDTALDPVIDDVYADPQARSELLHGEFIRAHQASRWNGVLVADPFDHGERKRLAMGAAQPFLIEVCDDLQIGQLLRQSADLLDDFRRTTYRFGSRPGQIDSDVGAGTALPAHMQNELPLVEQFLHRDVLDEESQHTFALLRRGGWSSPQAWQIAGQCED